MFDDVTPFDSSTGPDKDRNERVRVDDLMVCWDKASNGAKRLKSYWAVLCPLISI